MQEETVLRVNQLDACELDDTISDVLQHHFLEIFRPLQSVRIDQMKPELKALMRCVLWNFSLGSGSGTFGQRMLSLVYVTRNNSSTLSSIQRIGLFYSFVLSEWVVERGDGILWKLPGNVSVRLLHHGQLAVKALSLINFMVFLVQGCYPTLKERLLGLHILPTSPQTLRTISHRYLTREILWHGFSEFMFFVLPHFNLFTLWNMLRRVCNAKASTDNKLCSFCEGLPTVPHISDCGHLYCYYCLSANLLADSNFPCSMCNQLVKTITPASETIFS
jgi:peroxin-2